MRAGHILLVNSVPICCSDLFFKMSKTAQICCIYTCEKKSAAETGSGARCGSGKYFLIFHVCLFYFVTGAGTILRLRNRAVIFSFRSLMRSRINKVRFVNIFLCPVPHHKCGHRSALFLSCDFWDLEFFQLRLPELVSFFLNATYIFYAFIFYALLIYSLCPRLFAPAHFILF
jgi:hypothetical protein